MTYPSILMFLDDDARAKVRNEQAVRFARHLGSHVEGLCCLRPAPIGVEAVAAMGAVVEPLTADLQAARRGAAAREQHFRSLCDSLEVASFETEVDDNDDMGRAIVKRAALHDLVIVGQPDPAQAGAARRRAAVDEIVLHSPRPTLLLPYAGHFDEFGKTALVAWDGSHGAARAAADALPLLRLAQTVHVVVFDTPAGPGSTMADSPAQDVVRWLGRHGVRAVGQARHAGSDIGNALLSLAADLGADLLVMGCWGHARLAERLLGGVTRTVMASMTVPVLTSH